MNKMLTGAIAISASALLLVGGGGTLAMWNVAADVTPGTITSGRIGLNAHTGGWSNSAGPIKNINSYRIVPGETLTYTQSLDVDIEGDNAAAVLSIDGGFTSSFEAGAVQLSGELLSGGTSVFAFDSGTVGSSYTLDEEVKLYKSYDLTGKLHFTFNAAAKGSANSKFTFDQIVFGLTQVAK